ncbi:MAG: HEAT repeat domain-containing protein [Vampirovibrionia bacterium]
MFKEIIITNLLIASLTGNSSYEFPKVPEFDTNTRTVISHKCEYQIIVEKLNNPNFNVKAKTINKIGDEKITSCFDILLTLLKCDDHRIKGMAAISLGKLDKKEAIPALILSLRDDHPGVRGSAALSLGRLKAKEATSALISALSDTDNTVVLSATYSLGIIGSEESIKPVIKLLSHDHPQIRENAAWVLGLLKSKEALPYLEPLTQDLDENVRNSVKRAIFNIKYSMLSDTSQIKFEGGKGDNFDNAIKIIGIKNSLSCLRSQKEYIKQLYGDEENWEQIEQTHIKHNNKHYNLITIKETDSGTIKKFYFDISDLFHSF